MTKRFILFLAMACGPTCAYAKIEVGKKIDDFTLTDMLGDSHKLSDFKGKPIVLEWMSATCPFTLEHYERGTMAGLNKKFKGKVHWLAIDSSFDASSSQLYSWSMRWKVSYPILLDKTGQIGRRFGASSTPHMFVIDKDRVLRYAGAVDDDVTQSKPKITNYVDEALTAVLAGKPVTVKESKPYGCGVKYAPVAFPPIGG